MVVFRPHLVYIRPKDSGKTPNLVRESLSHEPVSSLKVRGQVTQESPAKAFERFGVELDEPWLLLANAPASDASPEAYLVEGARIEWTWRGKTRSFVIVKTTLIDVGQAADNLAVIMKGVQN